MEAPAKMNRRDNVVSITPLEQTKKDIKQSLRKLPKNKLLQVALIIEALSEDTFEPYVGDCDHRR